MAQTAQGTRLSLAVIKVNNGAVTVKLPNVARITNRHFNASWEVQHVQNILYAESESGTGVFCIFKLHFSQESIQSKVNLLGFFCQ